MTAWKFCRSVRHRSGRPAVFVTFFPDLCHPQSATLQTNVDPYKGISWCSDAYFVLLILLSKISKHFQATKSLCEVALTVAEPAQLLRSQPIAGIGTFVCVGVRLWFCLSFNLRTTGVRCAFAPFDA